MIVVGDDVVKNDERTDRDRRGTKDREEEKSPFDITGKEPSKDRVFKQLSSLRRRQ